MSTRKGWQGMVSTVSTGSAGGWLLVGGGAVRIGDREREEAARVLGDHFAEGRLDRGEYDDRLAAAFAARTERDLAVLFADLPRPHPGQPVVAPAPRSRGFSAVPFLPVVLGLVALSVAFGAAWIFWAGLGVYALVRRPRFAHRPRRGWSDDWGQSWGQRSGSRRPPRGSWA